MAEWPCPGPKTFPPRRIQGQAVSAFLLLLLCLLPQKSTSQALAKIALVCLSLLGLQFFV